MSGLGALEEWFLALGPWSRAGLAVLLLDLLALVSIWTSRLHAVRAKVIWTLVVALLPVLGAVSWVVLGRVPRRKRPGAQDAEAR